MLRLFLLLIFHVTWLCVKESVLLSASPVRTGHIELGSDAELSVRINFVQDLATFELIVTNASELADLNTSIWVAFGFGEPSSGSFIGSDLVSFRFPINTTNQCTAIDGYVPFVAYPLDEVFGGVQFEAKEDKCQSNVSWEVIRCRRNAIEGSVFIHFQRQLSAHDLQDREIVAGVQNILYAYGKGSQGLSSRAVRHSKHVTLFDENGVLPESPISLLPKEVNSHQLITAANYIVPAQPTSFACTSVEASVPFGQSFHVIAFEPELKAEIGSLAVHSMVLYACPKFEQFPFLHKTLQCDTRFVPRPQTFCNDLLYTWAPGVERFVLPDNVGFLLHDENKYLVLETKYVNVHGTQRVVDGSGVRLHYTSTRRKYDAGSLILGDTLGSLQSLSVSKDIDSSLSITCPKECTREFKTPLRFFATSPHLGPFGKSIQTYKYSAEGKYISGLSRVLFWSAERQWTYVLPSAMKLLPGEQLSTNCKYDTSKRPNTTFGNGVYDEMCSMVLFYYPRQSLGRVTGMPVLKGDLGHCGISKSGKTNVTLCGKKILFGVNVPLKGAARSDNRFGKTPGACFKRNSETTPTADPQSGGNPVERKGACFPADAVVKLANGNIARMDKLKLGDFVESGDGKFSRVFAFTHRQPELYHEFVTIRTENRTIHASAGHFLYSSNGLLPAREFTVGDAIQDERTRLHLVTGVTLSLRKGLFSPQTENGNIIVSGLRASCYTKAVSPMSAHASLSFFRMLSYTLGTQVLSIVNGFDDIPFLRQFG